jgi:hypothetical protein
MLIFFAAELVAKAGRRQLPEPEALGANYMQTLGQPHQSNPRTQGNLEVNSG